MNSKLSALAAAARKHSSRIVRFGDAEIEVQTLSTAEARAVDSRRRALEIASRSDNAEEAAAANDAVINEVVGVFIRCARDPETGKPYATEKDRKTIEDEIPQSCLLEVFRVAAGLDPEQAAKN
jgi:predicted nucleic acid-binding protein